MTNYEKALELVKKGIAKKHFTFKDTGCIFIDLGGRWEGYILPKNKYVEVAIVMFIGGYYSNVHAGYGNIDLSRLMVFDADHRHDYDRHIEKIKD